MSCRENTSSKPTSLPRAVSTASSAASDAAGRDAPRRCGGRGRPRRPHRWHCRRCRTLNSRPPAPNRSAMAAATAAMAASLRSSVARSQTRRSRPPWLPPRRPGRASRAAGVVLVALDERVEEVGASRSRLLGVDPGDGHAGMHERPGHPAAAGSTRVTSTCSRPAAVRTTAAGARPDLDLLRSRPSSAQVMQTVGRIPRLLPRSVAAAARGARGRRGSTPTAGGRAARSPVVGWLRRRGRRATTRGRPRPPRAPTGADPDGLGAPRRAAPQHDADLGGRPFPPSPRTSPASTRARRAATGSASVTATAERPVCP